MGAKIYYDKDAKLSLVKNKTVAVIGYGSQGHAQAQNMRDSGVKVVIGLKPGGASRERAVADGFEPVTVAEAAARAQIVQILVPDTMQKEVYYSDIAPHMKKGKALVFSHGFNIHYGQIVPPADVDVYMVAPKGPGHLVRRVFQEGGGVPCLIAVAQNATHKAKDLALAHAAAVGAGRAAILETTFKEETETDLFGEQSVLCGGLSELLRAGFDTLVEAGYQPEIAYFECLHEMKLIVDLVYEGGISNMRSSISDTAKYGDMTRGRRIVNDETRREMKTILGEIQSGAFAKEWILENLAGRPEFNRRKKTDEEHLIERVGKALRSKMVWLGKKKG